MQRVCWGNPSNANVSKKKLGDVLVFVITGVESTKCLPRPCTGVFPGLLGQRISLTYLRQTGHGTRNAEAGLCHTAATFSRDTKVALFYLSGLAPKFFTARSREIKQSFSVSRDNMAAVWIRPMCGVTTHGRQWECECRLLPQDCRACKYATCERTTQTREEYACPRSNSQGTRSTTLHCNEFPCQKAKPASGLR